jgi:hypothetical protein
VVVSVRDGRFWPISALLASWPLDAMVADPAFLAGAARRGLELLPARAEELEGAVAEAFRAPAGAIEIARKYYRQ